MPSRELPARPNLEQLKKQAKSLLDAAKARDRDALRRFAVLPSLSGKSLDEIATAGSGAARCPVGDRARARIRVLERTAGRSRVAHAVVRRGGRRVHPLRHRRRDRPRGAAARAPSAPRVGHAAHGAGSRRRCGGRGSAQKAIRSSRRSQAGRRTGSRCSTSATRRCTSAVRPRLEGLVDIARRLCALGANPNAEYHWNWHPELPRTALWAAVCAVGTPAACGGAARGGSQPDGWRDGAHCRRRRRTSMRSNCCTATA